MKPLLILEPLLIVLKAEHTAPRAPPLTSVEAESVLKLLLTIVEAVCVRARARACVRVCLRRLAASFLNPRGWSGGEAMPVGCQRLVGHAPPGTRTHVCKILDTSRA